MIDHGLLIIDMQKDFVLPGAPACIAGAFDTVPVIARALALFRQKGRPVFHVVREHRADGGDVESIRKKHFLDNHTYAVPGTPGCETVGPLNPLPGEYRIVKKRFSAFMNTELDFILRQLGVSHLVVCGTQYPTCVRCTIFDAAAYGYQVTLLTDGTSAQTPGIAEANIRDIQNLGVTCLTTGRFIELHQTKNRDL